MFLVLKLTSLFSSACWFQTYSHTAQLIWQTHLWLITPALATVNQRRPSHCVTNVTDRHQTW